jgi:hypothetical protein
MNRYVFYNNTDGDLYWIKTVTEQKAQRLCSLNSAMHMSYVLEESLNGNILNHMTDELDLTTTPFTVRKAGNKGVVPASIEAKQKRNALLTASDWTQGDDSPLSDSKKAEWQTYRQALRDFDYAGITEDYNIPWPTKPQ